MKASQSCMHVVKGMYRVDQESLLSEGKEFEEGDG